jgi:dihydrofolate reductase
MAKLIAQTFLTIDGVMEAPDKWQLQNNLFDEKMGEPIGGAFQSAGALLLGRVTYQEFAAHWPNQKDDPFADLLNNMPKYVVSNTLTSADWKNTKIIRGDAVAEVNKLKRELGKDVLIVGSATLVSGLTDAGVIDEYQLFIHPVVVAKGKRLFKDGIDPTLLTLVSSQAFGTGVVELRLRYRGKAKA